MSETCFLSEAEWRDLVRDVHAHQVIPVIGPELVTVGDSSSGQAVALTRHLAPKLAAALRLDQHETISSLNEAVSAHLLRNGARKFIYSELRELLDGFHDVPLSTPLLELAGITDFDLYISSTFDPFLALALEKARPGFRRDRGVLAYHPTKKGEADLPTPLPRPFLYHILGHSETYPEFAVCEEDYMEFLCGLIEQTGSNQLPNLTSKLKNSQLLLLGAPSSDWIVRFFLRMARQQRLTERGSGPGEYLTDRVENLSASLVFFFDKLVNATRVIPGDPSEFVRELAARWRDRYGPTANDQDFLSRLQDDMPRGAVFISYASEDLAAVLTLARSLSQAGVPVWLDKQRLQLGENYERSLEHAVKDDCSFFLSVISKTTESNPDRYFHKERGWAAQKHVDGFVFYLPVLIDDVDEPRREPVCFGKCHRADRLLNGSVTGVFIQKVQKLVEEFRVSRRPRG